MTRYRYIVLRRTIDVNPIGFAEVYVGKPRRGPTGQWEGTLAHPISPRDAIALALGLHLEPDVPRAIHFSTAPTDEAYWTFQRVAGDAVRWVSTETGESLSFCGIALTALGIDQLPVGATVYASLFKE